MSKLNFARQLFLGTIAWFSLVLRSFGSAHARVELGRVCHAMGVFRRSPNLPKMALSKLAPGTGPIELSHITSENWQVTTFELAAIVSLAISRDAGAFFEFGTFDGRTSLNVLRNVSTIRAVSIDLPPAELKLPDGKQVGTLIGDEFRADGRFTQLLGNSLRFDFTPYHGAMDVVFIDAGHSYECAIADSISACRLIGDRGGVVIWHDYATWPGVTRAVEEVQEMTRGKADLFWIEGTTLAVMTVGAGKMAMFK